MPEDLITRAETLEVGKHCDCGDDDCVLAGRRRNKALAALVPELVAEVRRLRARAIPETVTRVDVIATDSTYKESWAERWDVYVQDDGRTLKLRAQGSGSGAQAERNRALAADMVGPQAGIAAERILDGALMSDPVVYPGGEQPKVYVEEIWGVKYNHHHPQYYFRRCASEDEAREKYLDDVVRVESWSDFDPTYLPELVVARIQWKKVG